MRIIAPNHTQTPNDLFDNWLPLLGEVELKVLLVIMRKTFGYHKTRDRISLSQMKKLTGAHQSNIVKATESLQSKGLIIKEIVGVLGREETYYELVVYEEDSNNYDQSRRETPTSLAARLTKETIKEKVSLKNDIVSEDPLEKQQLEDLSDLSSFSDKGNSIVSFDPATYRLANGRPLSLRMQRALAKYDHSARGRLMANIAYYEQYAKTSKKPISDHERCLQDCINKDYAGKETIQWQNDTFAKIIASEHPSFEIKILKTVVHLSTRSNQEPMSIPKNLPPETFANILENAIRNWMD